LPVTRPPDHPLLLSASACYQKLLTLVANIWEARLPEPTDKSDHCPSGWQLSWDGGPLLLGQQTFRHQADSYTRLL